MCELSSICRLFAFSARRTDGDLIISRYPTVGGSLKLIRISLSGNIEAYVNPDHVASIEAQGEQRTVVSLGNAKLLDIDEAVGKVAQILQGRAM
jgi:hypothetical protein